MNKNTNTIIGIVLMVALFVGYGIYQASELEKQQEIALVQQQKKEEALKAQQERAKEERAKEAAMTPEQKAQRDSINLANAVLAKVNQHGETLLVALNGESTPLTLENDYMSVTFDNRGGKITDVTLKKHMRYADGERTEPVKMMVPGSASFGIDLHREGSNGVLKSNDYLFDTKVDELENAHRVTMKLQIDPEAYIEYVYTMYNTGDASRDHLIDFAFNQHGIDKYLENGEEIIMRWGNKSMKNERSFTVENNATTVAFYENEDEEVEQIAVDGKREHHRDLGWIALKQQYFSSVLLAKDPIHAGLGFKTSEKQGADYVKNYDTRIIIPHSEGQENYKFAFYYGPNDFTIMKGVELAGQEKHVEELIPLGGSLVGWINRILTIPVFQWLKGHGLSFGIIILILTIMVKLIILPLTYKSYMSTAKMRAVRPELEELNKKYPNPDDAMKKQQATMELYQKAGISPMGGCLPLLIQMPILWAMFRFLPASIELRGESFLWANDLSSYDSVLEFGFNIPFYGDHVSLFALLMTLSLFGYSFMTYKQQSATTAGQPGAGMMKFMMVYFMPLMMLCVMNSFSSGLCYYYFLSQIFTMIIMFAIRRTVNDDKVRERLLANASKPRKKSKFQERYEEALRQQQETLNREQRRQRR